MDEYKCTMACSYEYPRRLLQLLPTKMTVKNKICFLNKFHGYCKCTSINVPPVQAAMSILDVCYIYQLLITYQDDSQTKYVFLKHLFLLRKVHDYRKQTLKIRKLIKITFMIKMYGTAQSVYTVLYVRENGTFWFPVRDTFVAVNMSERL